MISPYIYIIVLITSRGHSGFDDDLLSVSRVATGSKEKAVKYLSRYFSLFFLFCFLVKRKPD